MTNLFYKILPFLLWALMAFSAAMIIQQFIFPRESVIHHAFICTAIFIFAALGLKHRKSKTARIGVAFAICGMALGVWEVAHLASAIFAAGGE
ncbi:MAG: hypothetical protein EA357_05895 [Micavibrio sp.]|nr:MAG: hypothetical protein EA357_05895 [Micavibrio sp.]